MMVSYRMVGYGGDDEGEEKEEKEKGKRAVCCFATHSSRVKLAISFTRVS